MDDDARDMLDRFRVATSSAPDDPTRRAIWRAVQGGSAGTPTVPTPAWPRVAVIGLAVAAALALLWGLVEGIPSSARSAVSAPSEQAIDQLGTGATTGDAGTRAASRAPAEVASSTSAVAPPVGEGNDVVPTQRPSTAPRPPSTTSLAASEEPAVQRPDADALRREATLLQEARAAALRGDRSTATAALDRHARAFPRGALAPERWVLRVELACAADDPEAARREAAAFAASYPSAAAAVTLRERPCDSR